MICQLAEELSRLLGQHLVAPFLDLVLLHETFQKERISFDERFGGGASPEDGHVTAARVSERAHSHYLAAVDELVQECLVPVMTAMISARLFPALLPITANNMLS